MRSIGIAALVLLASSAPVSGGRAGELDPSFGRGGVVVTPLGGHSARLAGVTVLGDESILALGSGSHGRDDEDFTILKYRRNGSLDPGFGRGGTATVDFANRYDFAAGLAVQPDGRIVVVGTSYGATTWHHRTFSQPQLVVTRLDRNGVPDPAFGTRGRLRTSLGNAAGARGESVALLSGGRLLVLAARQNGPPAFVRLRADGTLDPAYGTGGIADRPSGRYFRLSDGRYVAATVKQPERDGLLLTKVNLDGTVDRSYGAGGTADTGVFFGPGDVGDTAPDALVLPDDRLVFLAYMERLQGEVLVWVDASGRFFTVTMMDMGVGVPARDPQGRLVMAAGSRTHVSVSRWFKFSAVDRSFGDGQGWQHATVGNAALGGSTYAVAVVFQRGRIVVAAMTGSTPEQAWYGTHAALAAFHSRDTAPSPPPSPPSLSPSPTPTARRPSATPSASRPAPDSPSPVASTPAPASPRGAAPDPGGSGNGPAVAVGLVVLAAVAGATLWWRVTR